MTQAPPPPPVPLARLSYAHLSYRGRPGIISAIAVLSIVVASFSILASCIGGMWIAGIGAMAGAMSGRPGAAAGAAPAGLLGQLSSTDVAAAVAHVTRNAPLNPQQTAALQAELNSPSQQVLYVPTPHLGIARQIVTATPDGQGGVVIVFYNGSIMNLSSTGSAAVTLGTSMAFPMFQVDVGAVGLGIAMSVGNVALAILLLVAGIFTLRQSSRGGKLHWIYVLLKIPMAIGTGAAWGWVITSMAQATSSAPGGFTPGFYVGLVMAVILCLYPLGLIFALLSRPVRNYYASSSV